MALDLGAFFPKSIDKYICFIIFWFYIFIAVLYYELSIYIIIPVNIVILYYYHIKKYLIINLGHPDHYNHYIIVYTLNKSKIYILFEFKLKSNTIKVKDIV